MDIGFFEEKKKLFVNMTKNTAIEKLNFVTTIVEKTLKYIRTYDRIYSIWAEIGSVEKEKERKV